MAAKRTRLTDLELTVLGNVWKKGTCTSYEVLREFATSTSAYYRSGAGSIYPMMSRLENGGYILATVQATQARWRKLYSITPAGRKALEAWMSPPIAAADAMIAPDLIRTRMYFLGAVSHRRRLTFLAHVEQRLTEELQRNKQALARYRETGNRFSTLAMEGAIAVMRARLLWAARIRRTLADECKIEETPAIRRRKAKSIGSRVRLRSNRRE